jgi:hydroxypyruvate reductase
VLEGSHPVPDERSLAAGRAVRELVERAAPDDVVIALVSGGASALVEAPRVPLAELRALIGALMAAGAPIAELNAVRGALSDLKAGRLALACAAPIVTLVASDVIGDPLDVIGSGPTIGPWLTSPGAPIEVGLAEDARRRAAIAILERRGLAIPPALSAPIPPRQVARADRARLVAPLAAFADAALAALAAAGVAARRLDPPLEGDVTAAAHRLAALAPPFVAWGEPTLRVPADHGDGGRAQQLALTLAQLLRGTSRALLVAGTDGVDGPSPRAGRPSPAGAFIDGTTWDAIAAAGVDPALALARCDAGTALAAAGALFVPGPTGVNHADVVIAL